MGSSPNAPLLQHPITLAPFVFFVPSWLTSPLSVLGVSAVRNPVAFTER